MAKERDPVEKTAGRSRDLYDIATWEERTSLDGLSVALYRFLTWSARAVIVLTALLILISILAVSGLSLTNSPVIAALTILSALPALGLAAYVWYTDVTTSEPLSLLVATFLLGVLMATFAAIVNSIAQPAFTGLLGAVLGSMLFFYLVVAPVEETVKMLAVRLYAFRSDRFNAVIDGTVYGAMAGLGFATIENALYITRNVAGSDLSMGLGLVGAGGGIAAVRALAGPGHVIYAAFAGYYLGLAKFNPEDAGPIVIKGLVIASFIHATYNVTVGIGSSLIAGLTGLPQLAAFVAYIVAYDGFFGLLLLRKIRRYGDAYRSVAAERESPATAESTKFE